MARDTIKVITFLIFGCMYVTASATGFHRHHKGVCMCVSVYVCVCMHWGSVRAGSRLGGGCSGMRPF